MEEVIEIWKGSLPFLTGLASGVGSEFPKELPFSLGVEARTGRMLRLPDIFVDQALKLSYRSGSHVGNAMDDTPLGRPYCDDLLSFIQSSKISLLGSRVLEIGCGRGYLLRRLSDLGADAVGVEPGHVYEDHWKRHKVKVFRSFFPSDKVDGPFDLVVAYGVLEHVVDPVALIKDTLLVAPNGYVLFTVPNCDQAIAVGDPSILIHEHISYFTERSLSAVAEMAGAEVVNVSRSLYGNAIHILLKRGSQSNFNLKRQNESIDRALRFGKDIDHLRLMVEGRIKGGSREIGIVVPTRALNILPKDFGGAFYDDDPELIGKRLGGYELVVEPIDKIHTRSHSEVWVCSHSFFDKIRARLLSLGVADDCIVSLTALINAKNGL